jgi:hypothetical protein
MAPLPSSPSAPSSSSSLPSVTLPPIGSPANNTNDDRPNLKNSSGSGGSGPNSTRRTSLNRRSSYRALLAGTDQQTPNKSTGITAAAADSIAKAPDQVRRDRIRFALQRGSVSAKFDVSLEEGYFSAESICANIVQYLEATLASRWVTARQVAQLLELFRIGKAAKTSYGTYRVELLVVLFSRILDLHNFEQVMSVLSPSERASVLCRIGCLNIFNPLKIDGSYELDVGRWDERHLAKMFVHLYFSGARCKYQ